MRERDDSITLSDRDFYHDAWAIVYSERYCIPYALCLIIALSGADPDTDPDATADRDEPLH